MPQVSSFSWILTFFFSLFTFFLIFLMVHYFSFNLVKLESFLIKKFNFHFFI